MIRFDFNSLRIFIIYFFTFSLFVNCSGSDDANSSSPAPSAQISVNSTTLSFGEVLELSHSAAQSIEVSGSNLSSAINISTSSNFEVSLDNTSFGNEIAIANDTPTTVYVRFSPQEGAVGAVSGTLTLSSPQASDKTVALSGVGLSNAPVIISRFFLFFAVLRCASAALHLLPL